MCPPIFAMHVTDFVHVAKECFCNGGELMDRCCLPFVRKIICIHLNVGELCR